MTTTERVELKPCPFCGKFPAYYRVGGAHYIGCRDGCQVAMPAWSEAEAIAAWNTRPPVAGEVEEEWEEIVGSNVLKEIAKDHCIWAEGKQLDGEPQWNTSCGEETLLLETSCPTNAGMKFCPFCGKSIVEKLPKRKATPREERILSRHPIPHQGGKP